MAINSVLAISVFVSACGGGGGGTDEAKNPTLDTPTSTFANSTALEIDTTPAFFSGATVNLTAVENASQIDLTSALPTATINSAGAPSQQTEGNSLPNIYTAPTSSQTVTDLTINPGVYTTDKLPATSNSTPKPEANVKDGIAIISLLSSYKAVAKNAPRNSDVPFSPRFDRAEAPIVARAYMATRTEWSYIKKASSIAALRDAVGEKIGGSINNNIPTPNNLGAAIDFDGKAIIAPWMTTWGAIWNSCATPEGKQALTTAATEMLALGVSSVQMDDPGMQVDSEYFGAGDFSSANLRGFGVWVGQQRATGATMPLTATEASDYKNYLRTRYSVTSSADYIARRSTFATTAVWRNYMRSSVADCLGELHRHIAINSGGTASFTLNIHTPYPWGSNAYMVPYGDYVVGEVDAEHDDFQHIFFFSNWLRSEGQRWIPVFPVSEKFEQRRKIAMTYASGATPMVPWDMWMPPSKGSNIPPPRYFGNPADFGDLYAFVRNNSALLDGFEPLSRLNLLVYSDSPVLSEVQTQLKRLATLQVPYAVSVRGPNWSLPATRNVAGVNQTARIAISPRYSSDNYALLNSLSDANLSKLAVTASTTSGVNVVVTANPNSTARRAVHVVRTTEGDISTGSVTIMLNDWTLPAGSIYRIKILRPGLPTIDTVMSKSIDNLLTVIIPRMDEWAILEIEAQ